MAFSHFGDASRELMRDRGRASRLGAGNIRQEITLSVSRTLGTHGGRPGTGPPAGPGQPAERDAAKPHHPGRPGQPPPRLAFLAM